MHLRGHPEEKNPTTLGTMQRIHTDQNIDDVLDLRSNSDQIPRTTINGIEHFTYSISDQSAQFTLAVHID